jgi:hypothetical protein
VVIRYEPNGHRSIPCQYCVGQSLQFLIESLDDPFLGKPHMAKLCVEPADGAGMLSVARLASDMKEQRRTAICDVSDAIDAIGWRRCRPVPAAAGPMADRQTKHLLGPFIAASQSRSIEKG